MYRNEGLIRNRLDDTNRELCKDGLILAGCAVVSIASIYGTIHFSRELIDFYNSGLTLNFETRMLCSWEEAKVSFSIVPAAASGVIIRSRCDNFTKNLQYKKKLKKELNKIQNK